ncbi:MAG: hypothetical protein JJE51_11760 [Thermoanaerobaculia bacterium]|nr:hypothetical protein [Thermoanaerobaculia bacterium]
MRKLIWLALVAATLLVTGCGELLSLHALYTAQDRVFDARLEGQWESEGVRLLVQREGDLYNVTWQSKKDPSDFAKYEVHLVDINGVRFADALWVDAIGHMFLRVRVTEGQLHLAFLDSEWLRSRTSHEEADVDQGRKQAVLTVGTSQLRKVVGRFAREPKAYDEKELVFGRPN